MATRPPGRQAKAQGKPCAFRHARLAAREPRLAGLTEVDIAGVSSRPWGGVTPGPGGQPARRQAAPRQPPPPLPGGSRLCLLARRGRRLVALIMDLSEARKPPGCPQSKVTASKPEIDASKPCKSHDSLMGRHKLSARLSITQAGYGYGAGIGRSPTVDPVPSTLRPSRLKFRRVHMRHHLMVGPLLWRLRKIRNDGPTGQYCSPDQEFGDKRPCRGSDNEDHAREPCDWNHQALDGPCDPPPPMHHGRLTRKRRRSWAQMNWIALRPV